MILQVDRTEPEQKPFADALGDLIVSYSGNITMGEIVGAMEIHKLQIVIQNSSDDTPDTPGHTSLA